MLYTLRSKAYRGHYSHEHKIAVEQHGCTYISINTNQIKYISDYPKDEGYTIHFGNDDYILVPRSDKEAENDLKIIKAFMEKK